MKKTNEKNNARLPYFLKKIIDMVLIIFSLVVLHLSYYLEYELFGFKKEGVAFYFNFNPSLNAWATSSPRAMYL